MAQRQNKVQSRISQDNIQDDIQTLLREAEVIRNNPVSHFFYNEERQPLLRRFLLENAN
jgi:hypothetical protein